MENLVKIKMYYYDENGGQWVESLWANPVGGNYILENSPFYALNYAYMDEVAGKIIAGELFIDHLVKGSGNSNIQIYFENKDDVQAKMKEFKALDCTSEISNVPSLIALNVPKNVDYFKIVKPLLDLYVEKGILDYQEACLAHTN